MGQRLIDELLHLIDIVEHIIRIFYWADKKEDWLMQALGTAVDLPITLRSNRAAHATLTLIDGFCTALFLAGTCVSIFMLPRWPSELFLFSCLASAILMGWASYRGYVVVRHPNTLLLGTEGILVTLHGKSEFVRWRDINAVQLTSNGIIAPQDVVLALTPAAMIERIRKGAIRLGTENFVRLGSLWKTDRFFNSEDIQELIEKCRDKYTNQPN